MQSSRQAQQNPDSKCTPFTLHYSIISIWNIEQALAPYYKGLMDHLGRSNYGPLEEAVLNDLRVDDPQNYAPLVRPTKGMGIVIKVVQETEGANGRAGGRTTASLMGRDPSTAKRFSTAMGSAHSRCMDLLDDNTPAYLVHQFLDDDLDPDEEPVQIRFKLRNTEKKLSRFSALEDDIRAKDSQLEEVRAENRALRGDAEQLRARHGKLRQLAGRALAHMPEIKPKAIETEYPADSRELLAFRTAEQNRLRQTRSLEGRAVEEAAAEKGRSLELS